MSPADRIAELEEEIAQLRALLKVDPDRQTVARLQAALCVPYCEAVILATLYRAGSAWLTAERLDMALPPPTNGDPRSLNTILVRICNIRARLGREAVLGRHKAGYTLGAPGVLACKRAIENVEGAPL